MHLLKEVPLKRLILLKMPMSITSQIFNIQMKDMLLTEFYYLTLIVFDLTGGKKHKTNKRKSKKNNREKTNGFLIYIF